MNIHLLRIFVGGMLLIVLDVYSTAAPAPPHLAELATLKVEPRGRHYALAFSLDSKTLFTHVPGRGIWLWDVASRKHTATLEHKGNRLQGMVLSPDGKTLYSIGDESVWLWDVASRKHTGTLASNQEKGELKWMVLSPDVKRAACIHSKSIVFWDVTSCKQIGSVNENEDVRWAVFSPASKTLCVLVRAGKPKTHDELRIWDLETSRRARSFTTRRSLELLSADRFIKKPVLVDTRIGFERLPRFDESVKSVSFYLVDAFTGESILTCDWNLKDGRMPHGFALNRDETLLASFGPDSTVRLWDRVSGKSIAVFKHRPSQGRFLYFSPDGKILIYGYRNLPGESVRNGFLLFAVPSGKILADLNDVGTPAFSPDGRLMTANSGWDIKLWSIPDSWKKGDK